MAALTAGALAGCGSSDAGRATPTSTAPAPSWPPADGRPEYEAWATVIQSGDADARLCLEGVRTSLPPQCDGIAITNWDWDAVDGEDRQGSIRWADFHVRGTYEDGALTLTETPRRGEPDDTWNPDPDADRLETPCPEPDGGWVVTDPTKVDDESPMIAAARAEPDFGDIWIDDLGQDDADGYQDLTRAVFTVTFTGDLPRHEAELRELWGGPLCVWRAARTQADVDAVTARIQADVEAGWFGEVTVLSWGSTGLEGPVTVSVTVAPDDLAERLTQRYGTPVEVVSALRPVA